VNLLSASDFGDRFLVNFGFAVAAIASFKVSSGKGFSIDGAAIFSISSMIGCGSGSTLLSATSGALLLSLSAIARG